MINLLFIIVLHDQPAVLHVYTILKRKLIYSGILRERFSVKMW